MPHDSRARQERERVKFQDVATERGATAEAAAAVAGPRQINTAEGGGVRVAHLPETHPLDACGVAQLAMVSLLNIYLTRTRTRTLTHP